ncbi:MAG TPA: carboxypeptidase regulatory-like domain-containing protein [Blastocatellia bacterium]|nr:carboxypeptidase regulatory-like domain-containing protein [Blastocatellia bacterium]
MRHSIRLTMMIALASLAVMIVSNTAAFAQASSSTAELRGQVADSNGAAIPNAKLTLTDVIKGASRTATSDGEGNYVFLGLLPSSYELKVEAQGFGASSTRLDLTVGQQANIPIKLAAGKLEVQVDVVGGAEVVETNRTEQASTVDARQITNLPINRRSFLDYALLTPGVTSAENITDATDYRVAQTPQSGLSFGGNNGRGNQVSVDGAETIGASGAVQAMVSQEAVQEFQVVRNSFSAELGGASGGVVNIISKSGGNGFHGSIFGLFRDDTFDARNAFDFSPNGISPFSRQQFGGSVGGPLAKDKTFFFTSIERFNQEKSSFINLLTDPTLFQVTNASPNATIRNQAALFDFIAGSAAPDALKAGAAQLRGALTTTTYPRTIQLFTDATGQFPFDEGQTQFSARLDHSFSDRSTGYLRFNVTDGTFENQAAGSLLAVSRGREFDAFSGAMLASHNYQFSSTAFNELKLQLSYTRSAFLPNDGIGPELNIEGFGAFGRQIFLPSRNIERHYDIYDNVSKVFGTHSLKFGGSAFIHRLTSDNETFFGGRFNFGAAIPTANLLGATPAAQVANPINQFALTAPNSPFRDGNGNGLADVFEAPMTALQSFNLNLPIVYQQGFGTTALNQPFNRYAFYAQDTWRARQNLTLNYGLRYAIHDEALAIPTYKKDFQPRAGFSWDPWGNGKTVIRGGAGIYVGFLNAAISNVTTQLAGTTHPSTIYIVLATATSGALGLPTSFAVYQTLLARGVIGSRPITLADVSAAPLNLRAAPGVPLEVRFRLGPNYRNPTTYQSSFGIQRDLGGGVSLEAGYQFVRGLHLSRNRDINQIKTTGPINPLNPLGGPTYIRFPTAAQTQAGLTSDFSNPLRLQDNIYENTANSFYHSFTVQAQRRFSRNFSLNAHYTLAKSIDEVVDFNSDWSAQNPLSLRLDRSLSSFDQRHRLVLSGVFQSPANNILLKNWVLSPIFVAQSGRPFNLLLGIDANADGRSQSDRPGQAGRYTGQGEPFYSFDLRLGRRLFANDRRFLELTVEAFNLFNRTNLLGVNNVLGAACTTSDGANFLPCTVTGAVPLSNYNLRGRHGLRTTDPLGFTSAFDPRQLQFGARFNF